MFKGEESFYFAAHHLFLLNRRTKRPYSRRMHSAAAANTSSVLAAYRLSADRLQPENHKIRAMKLTVKVSRTLAGRQARGATRFFRSGGASLKSLISTFFVKGRREGVAFRGEQIARVPAELQ